MDSAETDVAALHREIADISNRFTSGDQDDEENVVLDLSSLEEYQQKRDLYIRRTVIKELIEGVGRGSIDIPKDDIVTDEILSDLENKVSAVLAATTDMKVLIRERLESVESKRSYSTLKLQELRRGIPMEYFGEDEAVEIDEEELAATEQELARARKARVEDDIRFKFMKQEEQRSRKELFDSTDPELDEDSLEERVTSQEEKNRTLLDEVENTAMMKAHYQTVKQLHEYVSDVQIIYVNADRNPSSIEWKVRLRLLGKYEVVVEPEVRIGQGITLKSVAFVQDLPTIYAESNDDVEGEEERLGLKFPPIDNLVKYYTDRALALEESVPPIINELKQRLLAMEKRAGELEVLRKLAMAKVGPPTVDGQQIVCSIDHAQLAFVLRLSVFCPIAEDSVYLDKLVGFGGWDKTVLTSLEDKVRSEKWKSPVDLVNKCKDEVERLQQEEGFLLPKTPRMPIRAQWEH